MLHRHDLSVQFSTLQANQSVGEGIVLFLPDILPDNLQQVGERHHRPAHHKIKLLFFFFGAAVTGRHVLQPDGLGDFRSHLHLLANAVHQMEMRVGKQDGQGNSRKPSTRTQVHNFGSRTELDDFRDAQRMQHMMLIQIGDVLA